MFFDLISGFRQVFPNELAHCEIHVAGSGFDRMLKIGQLLFCVFLFKESQFIL
jgi:hypothetical protein